MKWEDLGKLHILVTDFFFPVELINSMLAFYQIKPLEGAFAVNNGWRNYNIKHCEWEQNDTYCSSVYFLGKKVLICAQNFLILDCLLRIGTVFSVQTFFFFKCCRCINECLYFCPESIAEVLKSWCYYISVTLVITNLLGQGKLRFFFI